MKQTALNDNPCSRIPQVQKVTLPGFPNLAAEKLPFGVIRILPCEDPLSSDVFLIPAGGETWIFDVGAGAETAGFLTSIPGKKNLVLSHFHADHTTNLAAVLSGITGCSGTTGPGCPDTAGYSGTIDLYVSPYTEKHLKNLSIPEGCHVYTVTEPIRIRTDVVLPGEGTFEPDASEVSRECSVTISPLPATHAKGCLMLEYNEQLLFLGDSVYGMQKDGHHVFNAQLLSQQIRTLQQTKAPLFLPSHRKSSLCSREMIIEFLQSVYVKWNKNDPYIPVK